jgi:hypothetical protein
LREDSGRHEIEIADATRGDGARAIENLSKYQQPENRLNHPRKKLDGIVNQFANVGLRDSQCLPQVVRAGESLNPGVEM